MDRDHQQKRSLLNGLRGAGCDFCDSDQKLLACRICRNVLDSSQQLWLHSFELTMSSTSFAALLDARLEATNNSLLCVGIDPQEADYKPYLKQQQENATPEQIADAIYGFAQHLIDATHTVCICYKPNAAFFEALGDAGVGVLRRIILELIQPKQIPVLLDVKRGDIGSTAAAYAKACYEYYQADAVTVAPFMGYDSLEPFVTGGEYSGMNE